MDELTWYRTKNAARRLLKNRMRAVVAKERAATDERLSSLASFEEGAVKDAQKAYREVLAFWASESPEELRELLGTALSEATEHVREHYDDEDLDIDQAVVERAIGQFMRTFDPEEMLCRST